MTGRQNTSLSLTWLFPGHQGKLLYEMFVYLRKGNGELVGSEL